MATFRDLQLPKDKQKHRDERRGARAFLSSLTAVKYTQDFLSKPSIIWPGEGAFAEQERYAEICQSLC